MDERVLNTKISVRCKDCNKELKSQPGKTITCGCPNMVTVSDDCVTANNLTRVIMLNSSKKKKHENTLSPEDIAFHEKRKKRKIRKLDFEVR